MLERELKLIKNVSIREGTMYLVETHKDWIKICPPSPSGKFHSHENTMEEHIIDVVACAEEIAREFKIQGDDFDVLISACILHDIGRVKSTKLGRVEGDDDKWKYYSTTGWSQYDYGKKHPFESNDIIKEKPFHMSDRVRDLVKSHMSHWYPYAPQPTTLLQYCMCMSDYLATVVPKLNTEMENRRSHSYDCLARRRAAEGAVI